MLFTLTRHEAIAGISFVLAGATIGLLYYNIAPAKIYMGDTGSMFIGFTIFIFSVLFLNWCSAPRMTAIMHYIHSPQNAFILIFAMLFVPVFDALRVFALRASRGISPLKADRTHLHYYLLDAGLTHSQSVMVIAGTNMFIIVVAYLLQDLNPYLVLSLITAIATVVLFIVYKLRQKNLAKKSQNQ